MSEVHCGWVTFILPVCVFSLVGFWFFQEWFTHERKMKALNIRYRLALKELLKSYETPDNDDL